MKRAATSAPPRAVLDDDTFTVLPLGGAQEVGRMFGREIPQMTMAHQYLCSEAVPELTARLAAGTTKLPLLRDPARTTRVSSIESLCERHSKPTSLSLYARASGWYSSSSWRTPM